MPDRPRAAVVAAFFVARFALDDVTFAYPDGTQRVRTSQPSIFAPVRKSGWSGASGAGKSTIIRLLTRQFVPDTGRITIDGQDIATMSRLRA